MNLRESFILPAKRIIRRFLDPWSLYRLLLAWILVSAFSLIRIAPIFTEFDFFLQLSVGRLLAAVFVLWILLVLGIRRNETATVLMIAAATVYCCCAVTEDSTAYFSFGCALLISGIILLSPLPGWKSRAISSSPKEKSRMGEKGMWIFCLFLVVLFTAWFGGICVLKSLSHDTPNYDFGLFAQMFYYMKKTGLPLITCERDKLLSHFAVHMSPIYYLLLPFYLVCPSVLTLQIMQCLVVATGIIPLALLSRKHHLSPAVTAAFAFLYFAFPAYMGGCFYYLHENNFLAPLVLWVLYFFERDRKIPMLVSSVLLLLVKEDAAIYLAIIALYFFLLDLFRQHPQGGWKAWIFKNIHVWMFLLAAVYFVLVVRYLSLYGDGAMTSRFDNYIYDESGSLVTMVKAILKNPIYVIQQCFSHRNNVSTLIMLLSLGLLPVLFGDWIQLVLLIPYFVINLMSDYRYQDMIGFQYLFGSTAFFFYLSICNYERLRKKEIAGKLLVIGICMASIMAVRKYHGNLFEYVNTYQENKERNTRITEVLADIPQEASIVATSYLIAPLSQRDIIYDWEYTEHLDEVDYVVIDLRNVVWKKVFKKMKKDKRFERVEYVKDAVAVFQKIS